MARERVLALVLAGGEGGRLGALTEHRAKPAVPFGGVYRLIDFPLSNCAHSGITDVWVLQQYQPHSLSDHIANGRPWDLDRTYGGLRLMQPYLGRDESGWYRGNADAIYRNKTEIEQFDPELLLVLSADHVYALDYGEVIDEHRRRGGAATLVTTRVAREDAGRFGTVEVDGDGRVTEFEYKPDEPETDLVTTEVFVYEGRTRMKTLEDLAANGDEESSLEDFGHELLPRLVAEGRVHEYRLDGYWRDVGTIESYWEAHMELVAGERSLDLDDPVWPILTWSTQRPPARIEPSARLEDGLVSPGSSVGGSVARSVLGPGVVVEEGAEVRESILLEGAVVRSGARVVRTVVDAEATIDVDARVGADDEEIALVGQRAEVGRGATVAPGDRVEPVSTA